MRTVQHPPVTLQISLAPTDLPHARHILPHQLRQWAGQVDEVLLVVDLHQSLGRFSEGWKERLPGMRLLIEACCNQYPHARTVEVDYSPETAKRLGALFFGGKRVPVKDWNGSAFYSYVFGVYAAKHEYVLHMDSDMMYGGGSSTWINEAIHLLAERRDVVTCCPFPGPPAADGTLKSQTHLLGKEPFTSLAFRDTYFSTRHFFFNRSSFLDRIKALPIAAAPRLRGIQARIEGNPPYALVEMAFSQALKAHGLARVQFLGDGPGMWALHPPLRSALFYERLPAIIRQVETGEIPEGQYGCHDLNESMIDWSNARKTFNARAMSRAKMIMQRFSHSYPYFVDQSG